MGNGKFLYGLIGYPLSNTQSAELFNTWFKEMELDCSYQNFPLSNLNELSELFYLHPQIRGLNVTRPYKQAVIPLLQTVHPSAQSCGAVNCIRRTESGELTGYNTDVEGFRISLKNFLGETKPDQALVFGTGGASRAVQQVLEKMGISFLSVSRSPHKNPNTIGWDKLEDDLIQQSKLLINCTPVGMEPDEPQLLSLPYQALGTGHFCFDLIYKPAETPFLIRAFKAGAKIKNGMEMLQLQAMEARKIWFPELF